MSLDGYLDDARDGRLILSNDADFERVDEERAQADAILVGAATIRRDDPRLVVRSVQRRQAREAEGREPSPTKVTVTHSASLDPTARFFTTGSAPRLVYTSQAGASLARSRLGEVATVVGAGAQVDLGWVAADLHRRGIHRLLVEGGGITLTQFLTAGLADELQLVVAPLFVGDSRGRRFVGDGAFPWRDGRRAELAEVRQIGDVALLRYALSSRFTP